MPDKRCENCNVVVSEDPGADELHDAQKVTKNGLCSACSDEGSRHTGDQVVRASKVDVNDEDLARMLAEELHAEELRRWMSANDLTRARGSKKKDSALQAVAQDRVLVAAAVDSLRGLVDSEPHAAMCSCGFEKYFGEEEAAVEAAEAHKSEHPEHFPKAWGNGERRLYG